MSDALAYVFHGGWYGLNFLCAYIRASMMQNIIHTKDMAI